MSPDNLKQPWIYVLQGTRWTPIHVQYSMFYRLVPMNGAGMIRGTGSQGNGYIIILCKFFIYIYIYERCYIIFG